MRCSTSESYAYEIDPATAAQIGDVNEFWKAFLVMGELKNRRPFQGHS
jgi:hypothetical protein